MSDDQPTLFDLSPYQKKAPFDGRPDWAMDIEGGQEPDLDLRRQSQKGEGGRVHPPSTLPEGSAGIDAAWPRVAAPPGNGKDRRSRSEPEAIAQGDLSPDGGDRDESPAGDTKNSPLDMGGDGAVPPPTSSDGAQPRSVRSGNGKLGGSGWLAQQWKWRDRAGRSRTAYRPAPYMSGPYYCYFWREGDRLRSRYVSRAKLPLVRNAIAEGRSPQEILKLLARR